MIESVSKARNSISRANEIVNNKYVEIEQNLENALYSLNDAVEQIEACSSDISLNQNEIDNIETRLFLLKDLAKKHQTEIELLPEKLQELSAMLKSLEAGAEDLAELKKKTASLKEDYQVAAKKLSQVRKSTAKKLDKNIMRELPPLKMEKAVFQTSIITKEEDSWSETGWDSVCFEVSTNPNTPMGPLNKIASGGELSRFMLALKVNLAEQSQEETLVFDEIDTGVSGKVAEMMAEQIFVVTHSPQVAAFSNEHFKVEKKTANNITTTILTKLSPEGKLEEIARMLAGEKITKEARAAALVLLNKETEQNSE